MFAVFLIVDLFFFGANLLKIIDGGWFPLAIALVDLYGDDGVAVGPAADLGAAGERRACRCRPCSRP